MTEKELFMMAQEACHKAYAPFSGFRVGAALLTFDGEVFTGANVENSSYGGTICAERCACVKAVSEGYLGFSAIAIASDEGMVMPCGICRQFLYEFAPELTIIVGENEDRLQSYALSELFPGGFRLR